MATSQVIRSDKITSPTWGLAGSVRAEPLPLRQRMRCHKRIPILLVPERRMKHPGYRAREALLVEEYTLEGRKWWRLPVF